MRPKPWAVEALVFAGALALFATSVTEFDARVTDLSALRVLNGDVPYRDFWTMYAPGSFGVMALAFAVFGRQLLVSNVLGIVTSATAVALYYRLARTACGTTTAALLSALVAAAFFSTGYHGGFTSYPPAFLLILAAVGSVAVRIEKPGARWTIGPGLMLGAAVLFKHDVAGYAVIATAVALLVARSKARIAPAWTPTLVLGASAAAVGLAAAGVLVALGAGQDAWTDLVWFPLVVFRHVRGEYFPIVPQWRDSPVATARELILWGTCNVPLLALCAGTLWLWPQRRTLDARTIFISSVAVAALSLHWIAAHVQINTNAISMAAWGGLIAGAGFDVQRRSAATHRWVAAAGLCWVAMFLADPAYTAAKHGSGDAVWVGLPRLRGIRVARGDAVWMRGLSDAMASAAGPDAPLLFVGNRNDINVYAYSTPFWLTGRRPATRHHELHPGVTDTAPVQQRMLADIMRGSLPVVVREYRFDDNTLDSIRADVVRSVPIGSTLMDDWVAARYDAGPMFGPYEVMRANGRNGVSAREAPAER